MKVLIIGMPGCGNYGDDLISQYLKKSIISAHENINIGYLSGEINNSFELSNAKHTKFLFPQKSNLREYFKRRKIIISFIKKCDYVYIGGGGLFQDSHNLFTPHKYLRWILHAKCPIIIVGLGVGPIKHKHNKRYLRNILNNSGITIQVRDEESLNVLRKIGVSRPIQLNCDIVEGSLLPNFTNESDCNNISLGISIRPWYDLDKEKLIAIIKIIIKQYNVNRLMFFVFEYSLKNQTEFAFQNIIKNNFPEIPSEITVYGINHDFNEKLYSVKLAIASRYHANILWQKFGIPVFPIPYSPKVSSLYLKYNKCIKSFKQIELDNLTFYNLRLSEKYTLPTIQDDNFKLSKSNEVLINIYNIISFVYETIRSIYIRLTTRIKN